MIEDQLMVQKAADLCLSADTEVIKYLDRIRGDQNIADMETLDEDEGPAGDRSRRVQRQH